MSLSSDLISQFVKATKDETPKNSEATVQGTTVEYNGSIYVKLDGSDQLTPITTTTDTKPGERVTVLIKNHTATVTGNMSSPSARTDDVKEIGDQITQVEILVADKVSTSELEAEKARIEELRAENVTIKGQLTANNADISNLKAQDATITGKLTAAEAGISNLQTTKLDAEIADVKYATVEKLDATDAKVYNLEATYGEFAELTADKLEATEADISKLKADKLDANKADITYATIAELNAAKAHITELDADVADIDTLIFGSATGSSIQTSFANAVIAQLGNAQIKSAMIKDISADKIIAGDISTNNVRVVSDDGKLIISDETIQISDDNRVRVQIGKDASNDYSVNVWDADGNLMFSKGGITDAAIKEAIIRDDMVTDDANISASKLNINSLFEEINGSAHTIKSTKVYLDEKNQTLDVAFGAVTTDVDSVKSSVKSQGTQISAIQGQISSKIWQQDIETAVDNLEIGGRNLLPNTKSMTGYAAPSSVTYAQDSEGFTVASWSSVDTLDWRGLRVYEPIPFSLVRNKEVTVSLWVKTTDPEAYNSETNRGLSISFYLCPADSRTPGLYKLNPHYDTVLTDEWQKISITRTLADGYFTSGTGTIEDDTRLYVQIYNYSLHPMDVRKIKMEFGNVATDWTPAPEDVEGELQSLSTQYSSLDQTVNSISATVAKHASDISGVSSQVSDMEINLDGFKTTVGNTYTTKTDFNNLQIGGRNLVRDSAMTKDTEYWSFAGGICTYAFSKGYCEIYRTEKTDSRAFNVQPSNANSLLKPEDIAGSTYTLSAEIKELDGYDVTASTSLHYRCNTTDLSSGYQELNIPLGGATAEWQKVSKTLTFGNYNFDGTSQVCLALENAANVGICIRNIKLEKGNKATDWTPAPEDVEDEIQTLESRTAELEVGIDGVRTTVSSLKVGGRNLILDSEDEVSFKNTLKHFTLSEYGVEKAKNTKITMSFDARTDEPGVGCDFYMRYVDGTAGKGVGFSAANGLTAEYQRYTATVEVGDYSFAMFTIRSTTASTATNPSATATIFVKNIKVELGTMASDWTPAPEDMADAKDLEAYATKSEVEQTAKGITSTVSATYATKGDLSTTDNKIETLEIGGRNLLFNTKSMEGYSKHSSVTITDDEDGYAVASYSAVEELTWRHVNAYDPILFSTVRGKTVTVSLEVKTTDPDAYNADTTHGLAIAFNLCSADSLSRQKYRAVTLYTTELSEKWQKISITRTLTDDHFSSGSGDIDDNTRMYVNVYDHSLYPMDVRKFKMEFGNKATDWTPAPEDVDSAVDKVKQDSVDHIDTEVKEIYTQIKQLKDSLQWLIRGEDGDSAMYFDEEKQVYTFSAQPLLNAIDELDIDMKDAINLITGEGGVDERLSALRNELDDMVDYIKHTTYNNQPCIELGEMGNGFKLRITNTEIQFADGTTIPAYISNKKLMIEIAEVKKELQFDGFVWKKRVNSVTGLHHLGLLWKGVSS